MKKYLFLMMLVVGTSIMAGDLTVGIVYDELFLKDKDSINRIISEELNKNLDDNIKILESKDKKNLKSQLEDLEEEDVDLIYYMGIGSDNIDTTINLVIPYYYGGYSGNALAISIAYDSDNILRILEEVTDIDKLGIVYDSSSRELASRYSEGINEKIQKVDILGIESIEKIDSSYDAVINLSAEASSRDGFFREIPSFNLVLSKLTGNTSESLFGYYVEDEMLRRVRASSVSLAKEISGIVELNSNNLDTVFDYSVAKNLDIYPSNEILDTLKIVNKPREEVSILEIKAGLERVLNHNTTIVSSSKNLESKEYDINVAKSNMKPNLDLVSNYSKIDNDRAEDNPASAENTAVAGFEVTQVLYDPEIFSGINISKELYNAEEAVFRSSEIDEILAYIDTYLNVLSSKDILEVQIAGEELSKEFLKLAETRNRIGSGGPADIYRFQSEVADSMTAVEDAKINLLSNKKDLNRLLNRSSSENFEVSPSGIEEIVDINKFDARELYKPWNIEKLEAEYKEKALITSPKIVEINKQISIIEESYKGTKRRRYLPQLVATGSYTEDLKDPWGNGSSTAEADTEWNLGVGFTLPLYTGGEIHNELRGYEAQIEALEADKIGIENTLTKGITTEYNRVLSNNKKINLAEKSLIASEKALELQKQLYINGKITATDLLDSRNSYISAKGGLSLAIYEYYLSIARLENLSGKYYFEENIIEMGER